MTPCKTFFLQKNAKDTKIFYRSAQRTQSFLLGDGAFLEGYLCVESSGIVWIAGRARNPPPLRPLRPPVKKPSSLAQPGRH